MPVLVLRREQQSVAFTRCYLSVVVLVRQPFIVVVCCSYHKLSVMPHRSDQENQDAADRAQIARIEALRADKVRLMAIESAQRQRLISLAATKSRMDAALAAKQLEVARIRARQNRD